MLVDHPTASLIPHRCGDTSALSSKVRIHLSSNAIDIILNLLPMGGSKKILGPLSQKIEEF